MTIFRTSHNKNYTVINNLIAKDKNLSYKAKGIFLYAFSRPDDWTFSLADLINQSTDGRESVRSGLKELIDAGYLIRNQTRKNGKFDHVDWTFYETPQKIEKNFTDAENPLAVNTNAENNPLLSTKENQVLKESNKQGLTESSKNREALPAAAVAVFSCLKDLNIPQNEKEWLSSRFNEKEVSHAVSYCESPTVTLKKGLTAALKWACKVQPDIPESKDPEIIMKTNKDKIQKLVGDLDCKEVSSDIGVSVRFDIATKFIELVCGTKSWKIFEFEKSDCVMEFVKCLKENFSCLHKRLDFAT